MYLGRFACQTGATLVQGAGETPRHVVEENHGHGAVSWKDRSLMRNGARKQHRFANPESDLSLAIVCHYPDRPRLGVSSSAEIVDQPRYIPDTLLPIRVYGLRRAGQIGADIAVRRLYRFTDDALYSSP